MDDPLARNGYAALANWAGLIAPTARTDFDNFQNSIFETVYTDDFTVDNSGWFVDTQDICQAVYLSGFYRTATRADFLCLYRSPAEAQPNRFFSVDMSRGESLLLKPILALIVVDLGSRPLLLESC